MEAAEGDSLNDFEGGVSENLPSDGEYNALAIGDINGDSNIDVAFGGENYNGDTTGLYVYAGNGAGSWTASYSGLPTADSWGGLALGDADGDGKIELYAGNEGWGSHGGSIKGVGAWEYSGGSWSQSGITSPHSTGTVNDLRLLNFTKGPGLDIALSTSRQGDGGIRVYYGSGSSPITWTDNSAGLPTSGEYAGIDVRDLNNDGLPDIATVMYSSSGLHIYTQNSGGSGWFDCSSTLPSGAKSGSMLGVVIGDCNNDGNADIVYSTRDNGMRVLLGNGGGSSGGTAFEWIEAGDALPSSGKSGRFAQIQLADIDKDDDMDLLAPKVNSGLRLYLGNGNEEPGDALAFMEVTGKGLPTSGKFYGSTYLDLDDDGDLDVAGATWGDGVQVYRTSLSPSDEIPVADAGTDIEVYTADPVTLDGSGSYDPEDGQNIEYQWEVSNGNPDTVTLSDSSVVDPGFNAPTTPGDYTFTLEVKDSKDQWSDPDDVVVHVLNRQPLADAGTDLVVNTGESVTLNGSGSNDPEDGSNIDFEWNASEANPSTVTLSDNYTEAPSFTAPTTPGDYEFTLKVKDTNGMWSDPDDVIVHILNQSPFADAGVDITRTVNTTVILNGSRSYDPDGTVEHYNWSCTSHTVTLESADSPYPSFTPDEVGTYVFTLGVQDNEGDWTRNEDTVNVTVVPKGENLAPSGDAGPDQIVTLGDTVVLNGTGSNDPDGDIVSWEWNCTNHPGLTLQDTNSSVPSFVPDSLGTYTFSLRVLDNNGSWSSEDFTNITVEDAPMRPIADAGDDFTGEVGSTVFLDGSGSYDPDGFLTDYNWVCTSHILILDFPGSPSSPSFIPTEEGEYAFTLWVQDNDGISSIPDAVNVTTILPKENSAPVVNITSPNDRDVISGDVKISWTAYDPDGDDMTFSVEVSRNSWISYKTLKSDLGTSTREYMWSTDDPEYPNGLNYRIRVTATDTNATTKSGSHEITDIRIDNAPGDGDGEQEDDEESGFIPGFNMVTTLGAVVLITAITMYFSRGSRRKRKT